ncbi:MAG: hypothetical protein JRD88_04500 [Deltaproteobacteria bacterium]|nr:hypothetical protein [Deltaproteobacteria bacterium]
MSYIDLFPKVPEWSHRRLSSFLSDSNPASYQLLDVREPTEFEKYHLPGAQSFPLAKLQEGSTIIDSKKPTILYCRNGLRSHAAAQILIRRGFQKVCLLKGGVQNWPGWLTTFSDSRVNELFTMLNTAEDHALFAWQLEENTRRLYRAINETVENSQLKVLFAKLAGDESNHKATIKAIWEGLSRRAAPTAFPHAIETFREHDFLEGGMVLTDALNWIKSFSTVDLLDFIISLEINAYDHYLTLQRLATDENSGRLFELVSDEELRHVKLLVRSCEEFQSSLE